MLIQELVARLSRLFIPGHLPVDYAQLIVTIQITLRSFITVRKEERIDEILDVLEILPHFFISPLLYYGYLNGDWGETLPLPYEETRIFLDEHWDELYDEIWEN